MSKRYYVWKDVDGIIHIRSCLNEEDMMASAEVQEGFICFIEQEKLKGETPKEIMERLRNERDSKRK